MGYRIFVCFLISMVFFSCSNEKGKLFEYLESKHSLVNIDNGLYIFMPTATCRNCFDTIKSELLNLELNPSTYIIFVSNNRLTIKGHTKDFKNKSNLFYDLNNDANLEITGKANPFVFVVKNRKIIESFEVLPQNLESAKKTIRKYNLKI